MVDARDELARRALGRASENALAEGDRLRRVLVVVTGGIVGLGRSEELRIEVDAHGENADEVLACREPPGLVADRHLVGLGGIADHRRNRIDPDRFGEAVIEQDLALGRIRGGESIERLDVAEDVDQIPHAIGTGIGHRIPHGPHGEPGEIAFVDGLAINDHFAHLLVEPGRLHLGVVHRLLERRFDALGGGVLGIEPAEDDGLRCMRDLDAIGDFAHVLADAADLGPQVEPEDGGAGGFMMELDELSCEVYRRLFAPGTEIALEYGIDDDIHLLDTFGREEDARHELASRNDELLHIVRIIRGLVEPVADGGDLGENGANTHVLGGLLHEPVVELAPRLARVAEQVSEIEDAGIPGRYRSVLGGSLFGETDRIGDDVRNPEHRQEAIESAIAGCRVLRGKDDRSRLLVHALPLHAALMLFNEHAGPAFFCKNVRPNVSSRRSIPHQECVHNETNLHVCG